MIPIPMYKNYAPLGNNILYNHILIQSLYKISIGKPIELFPVNHTVIFPLYKSPIEKACNYFLNCTLIATSGSG